MPTPQAERFHADEIPMLDLLLIRWVRWVRSSSAVVRGYPRRASGLSTGAVSKSFEDMCEESDTRIAIDTDTVIRGLVPIERCAIEHEYDLCRVWRFPREPFEIVLARARQNVAAGLRRKGVWMGEDLRLVGGPQET